MLQFVNVHLFQISVSNELRDLEKRRQTMLYDLSTFTRKVEVQRHLSEKGEKYLNELRLSCVYIFYSAL